jgi:hypothetical protein
MLSKYSAQIQICKHKTMLLFSHVSFFFLFCSDGVWIRASHFLGSHCSTWNTPPTHFCSIFRMGSHFCLGLDLDCNPPIYDSLWNDRYVPPCLACFLRWGVANFLPRLALNLYSPDLCILNSWDHTSEPPLQTPVSIFNMENCHRYEPH